MDVFPQYLTGTIALTAANTFTTTTLNLPVSRTGPREGLSRVIEVLKVHWTIFVIDHSAQGDIFEVALSTRVLVAGQLRPSTPSIFCSYQERVHGVGTSGFVIAQSPYEVDLTGSGRGILLGVDTLHVSATSVGMAGVSSADFKLFYRFVDVSTTEYVGIVQQQQ